jgi:hypothetical protein
MKTEAGFVINKLVVGISCAALKGAENELGKAAIIKTYKGTPHYRDVDGKLKPKDTTHDLSLTFILIFILGVLVIIMFKKKQRSSTRKL